MISSWVRLSKNSKNEWLPNFCHKMGNFSLPSLLAVTLHLLQANFHQDAFRSIKSSVNVNWVCYPGHWQTYFLVMISKSRQVLFVLVMLQRQIIFEMPTSASSQFGAHPKLSSGLTCNILPCSVTDGYPVLYAKWINPNIHDSDNPSFQQKRLK